MSDLQAERDAYRATLRVIAGRQQPIDNLMSNAEIASAVLAAYRCAHKFCKRYSEGGKLCLECGDLVPADQLRAVNINVD